MIDYNDLIGKPYKEKGRGPDGYDCYGLCIEVCKRFGTALPEMSDMLESLFLPVSQPIPGDLVLVTNVGEKHAGVMIDDTLFLQVVATGRRGVHCMRIDHPWVSGRIEGYYRYAG